MKRPGFDRSVAWGLAVFGVVALALAMGQVGGAQPRCVSIAFDPDGRLYRAFDSGRIELAIPETSTDDARLSKTGLRWLAVEIQSAPDLP